MSMFLNRVVFLCVIGLSLVAAAAADEPLRIGLAETDITPPLGFPMAGYYHERLAEGQIDPLKAKAIVFRGQGEQAALVVCDLTGVSIDLATKVRTLAAERTGIPAGNIVVAATHSHTAPDYYKDLYLALAGKPQDKKRAAYIGQLIERIADAVAKAHAAAEPVAVLAGSARQETPVSFNRRFVMRDGSVRTWMNLQNPDVVRPAGPIDPEIPLVLVKSLEGSKPRGVFSNFALHLDTVGGLKWSADYPYFIEQAVKEELGPEVISVFGTGTCGDINHSDPGRRERNKTDFIGGSLGTTVQSALAELPRLKRTNLSVRSQVVKLPLQDVTPEELARAAAVVDAAGRMEKVDFFEHVTAYKQLILDALRHKHPLVTTPERVSLGLTHTWSGIGDALPAEVHAICIGDELAIVCLPGEVFVELGLAIKQGSPFRTTLIVELAGCVESVYIPTRAAYAQGSYEVTNSTLQPGSGERLVEAALGLLREAAAAAQAPK